jgi:hypothetical protein
MKRSLVAAFWAAAFLSCVSGRAQVAQALLDRAGTGDLIEVAVIPTPGHLLPLGPYLHVDPSGNVGLGTLLPGAKLDLRAPGQKPYLVNRLIAAGTEAFGDPSDFYVLLHAAYEAPLLNEHYVFGRLSARRGDPGGWNRKVVVDVYSASAYQTNRASTQCHFEFWDVCTCRYRGTRYMALRPRVDSVIYSLEFTGWAFASSGELLKAVPGREVSEVAYFQAPDITSLSGRIHVRDGSLRFGGDGTGERIDVDWGPGRPNALEFVTNNQRRMTVANDGTVSIEGNGKRIDIWAGRSLADIASFGAPLFINNNPERNDICLLGRRVGVGTSTPTATLDVGGETRTDVLTIDGGADLGEWMTSEQEAVEPGTVLCIDPNRSDRIVASAQPYDSRVAGVVSGANGVRSGIMLRQDAVLDGSTPVALAGRVWVRCSTENGPIEPGDLLTTAATRGHAMKATDRERAFGAVLGKAMSSLDEGTDLVLVLISLQ